jgi:predicted metal-dependent phosphoesterase TrpH
LWRFPAKDQSIAWFARFDGLDAGAYLMIGLPHRRIFNMLVDVHAKSSYSKGVGFTAKEVIEKARTAGLDAVAFCETLSTAHCRELLELAAQYDDIKVFIGVEIPTDRGILLGFAPEIDDFYLEEEWRWLTSVATPSAESVIELFESQGGTTIAARPYDLDIPFNMGDHIFTFERLGAVEVFNPRVGEIQNNFALEAAAFMGLSTVGGSDPKADLDVIGRFATFFDQELTTQRQFVEALRDAEYWAVQIGELTQERSSRTARERSEGRGERRPGQEGRGGRDAGRGGSRPSGGGGRDGGRGGKDRGRGGRDGGRRKGPRDKA